jgi:hypothetical protein
MFKQEEPIHIIEVYLYENGSLDLYGLTSGTHALSCQNIEEAINEIKDSLNEQLEYCNNIKNT